MLQPIRRDLSSIYVIVRVRKEDSKQQLINKKIFNFNMCDCITNFFLFKLGMCDIR